MTRLEEEKRIWCGHNGDADLPKEKKFLSEVKEGVVFQTWWPYAFAGSTRNAGAELKAIFGHRPFDTPKPLKLIDVISRLAMGPNDLILDSFAGSGTTGHAVLEMNKQDGGNRRFILVEMEEDIARNVTAERLRRVIAGYDKGGEPGKPVEGLGGGFRCCRLGVPLFDEFGDIADAVTFPDLAAHIFFAETGVPIPHRAQSEFLGTHQGRAVYLLFDEVNREVPQEAASNVLTPDRLARLPEASRLPGQRASLRPGECWAPSPQRDWHT